MKKRDLKTDLEFLEEGFYPSSIGLVGIAKHAIERALKAEVDFKRQEEYSDMLEDERNELYNLARELVDVLGRVTPRYLAGRLELDLDLVHEANGLLKKAKEVLGNDRQGDYRTP